MDWNQRFDTPDYLFGTEPCVFLRAHVDKLPPAARVLAVADGEGRNSVYLAQHGHAVTAFDLSDNAIAKARTLAERSDVEVDFQRSDLGNWDWSRRYDVVAAIFIQFVQPSQLGDLFGKFDQAIEPGGVLMLHGYAPRQVENGTGGPSDPAQLYTLDMLRAAFEGYDVQVARDYDAVLDEGSAHSGPSALIDFIARKPL